MNRLINLETAQTVHQNRHMAYRPREQPRFKNWGNPSFLPAPTNVKLQRSMASRGGMGTECPLPSRLRGLGERRSSPSRVWAETKPLMIFWGRLMSTFIRILMCNFMRFHASFRAFNSCLKIRDYYILASRSDVPL